MKILAMLFHAQQHACFAGEGETGAGGDESTPKPGGELKPGDGDGAGPGSDTDPEKFISRAVLTSALDHNRKTNEAAMRKSTGLLEQKLEVLTTSIEEKISQLIEAKPKKKEKGGDSELASLKKQLDDSQRQIEALRAEGDKSKAETAEITFSTKVKDALVNGGCTKPDAAFLVVRNHLVTDPDTGKIEHIKKDDTFGDLPYDLDKFVEEIASVTIIPELFRAQSTGAGSGAAGDKGGKKNFKFTKEQVNDPVFYKKNRDEIAEAMAAGQIKGIPATG